MADDFRRGAVPDHHGRGTHDRRLPYNHRCGIIKGRESKQRCPGVQGVQQAGIRNMAQQLRPVLDVQIMDLLADRVHIHSLSGEQQPEGDSVLFHFRACFQHGQDILFPVHLADKQDQGIRAQVPAPVHLLHVSG